MKLRVTFAGGVTARPGCARDVIYCTLLTGPKPGPVTVRLIITCLHQRGQQGFRRYTLPSRRFFSDVSLPALYDTVATHIHNLIDKNGLHVSFTTDIWTPDVSSVSMVSLTAQWLDQNFNMQKAMLHAQECPGSHTATMICQAFETMLA